MMIFNRVKFKKLRLNRRGVLDEMMDFVLLIVGSLVIFGVLWFVLDQGKSGAAKQSTELIVRTATMEHEVMLWRVDIQNGKALSPYNRLISDLKMIANTGIPFRDDPLVDPPLRPGMRS